MKKITKEIGQYTFARYLSEFLLAIRGFIIAKVLGPSSYGIWNMLKIFISFGEYTHLGSYDAVSREIPYNKGKGQQHKNTDMKRVAFTYSFLFSLVLAVGVTLFSFAPSFWTYKTEIQLASIAFLCMSLHWFVQHTLRGEKKITELSWYMFGYAFLNTAIGLALLFLLEIQGLLIGMAVTFILLFSILFFKKHLEFTFSFHVKKYKKLISIGYPILLLSLVFLLMQKIDSILVFIFLGSEMTGYYGLAAFITLIIHYIPLSLNTVLQPRMMNTLGKTNNISNIKKYLLEPHNILVKAIPFLLGIIILNIPWIIKLYLPEYVPAISTLQVLSAGIFFSALLSLPNTILIAINEQRRLVKKLGLVLLFAVVLDIIVLLLGYGILGVAYATACSLAIAYFVSMKLALQKFSLSGTQISSAFGTFLYFLIVLLISLMSASYLFQNMIFCILYLPFLIPLFRQVRSYL